MVNIELITNSPSNSLLQNFISQEIITERFAIVKGPKDKWRLVDRTKSFGNIYSEDNRDFIVKYAKRLLGKNFNSILISGLGLGVIPYACQTTTAIIDVIEIDKDVIDITKSIGHIHENTNIIHGDIHNFIPQNKYDIILFDHWLTHANDSEIDLLTQKFQIYLNDGGFLYFPVKEQFKNG